MFKVGNCVRLSSDEASIRSIVFLVVELDNNFATIENKEGKRFIIDRRFLKYDYESTFSFYSQK